MGYTYYNDCMSTLTSKIKYKRVNAKKEGLLFLLSKEEIQQLLNKASISVEQWSLRGYHLARYNDAGNYEINNCRFITAAANRSEKKISEKMKIANEKNLRLGIIAWTNNPEARHIRAIHAAATKREKGIPQSRKCQPGCSCGRHKNGGWNKGLPWKEWFPK